MLNNSHIGKIKYTDFKSKIKKLFKIEKPIKFYRKFIKFLTLKKNKFLGKEYVLPVLNRINIETTSLCNLKCNFCAYDKRNLESHPRTVMKNDNFINAVNQATSLGYKRIGLTPTTGDVFMDKDFISKLKILEKNELVRDCYFYTNFIPCSKDQIKELFGIKKLFLLAISIYGHDEESFCKFTKGNNVSYKKLVDNLNYLADLTETGKMHFEIRLNQRCKKNFYLSESDNELSRAIKNLGAKDKQSVSFTYTHIYDNWGDKISESDVEGMGIELDIGWAPKVGPCTMVFSRLNIGANGTVNGCHVRDADYTLKLGNINKTSLKEILSAKNETYVNLIEKMKNGEWPDVCKNCDVYSSIYDYPGKSNYMYARTFNDKSIKLKEFDQILYNRKKEIDENINKF